MKGRRDIPIHIFRAFPAGMAGLGLFLLRVITALTLGYVGYSFQDGSVNLPRLISVLLSLIGVLMIIGFATMISGLFACALLLASFIWLHPQSNSLVAMAAGLSLVLVLVGPGAYSLDARFFGWRRVEIARRRPKP
jgi:uncharacterized membrane protein YphA (DoxX/SURF4 family)